MSYLFGSLTPLNSIMYPSWQKFTVPYTSLQTAAITNSVLVYTLPIKGVVHAALMNVTVAFSGTTTLSLSLGIAGTVAKFVVATTVLSTGVTNGVALSTPDVESVSGTTAININAIATVQNLSSLTIGSADIYILTSVLP